MGQVCCSGRVETEPLAPRLHAPQSQASRTSAVVACCCNKVKVGSSSETDYVDLDVNDVLDQVLSCNLLHTNFAYKPYQVNVRFCLCKVLSKAVKMTTFTRIGGNDSASIDIDVTRRLSKIDPNIYGGFME